MRFYNAAALINELSLAQEQQRLQKFLAAALKQNLIILDELGFIPFSTTGAQLMFQFCSTLHERVALIVITNLKFADWIQVFGSEQLTAALLDRLTHKAHIIAFNRIREMVKKSRRQKRHMWPSLDIPFMDIRSRS